MHQLPHLYSWVKRQSGVPQVGVKEPSNVNRTNRKRGTDSASTSHGAAMS
jgi:hypothetical protein